MTGSTHIASTGGNESAYFDSRYFQDNIDDGLATQQRDTGITVDWWFFDRKNSQIDPIYDEGAYGGGLRWRGPFTMPVVQASRQEGVRRDQEVGFYTVDTATLVMSYRQALDSGLIAAPDVTNQHLKDRFVWDGRVWSPDSIQVSGLLGQGGTRATVIVRATQVKPDEMLNDPDFQRYAETSLQDEDPVDLQDFGV